MRVAVLCPTRGRREGLLDTYRSLVETSTDAFLIACVDEDDRDTYKDIFEPRLMFSYAPRTTIVGALNTAFNTFHSFDAYGYIVDDSRFKTKGWDKWLEEVLDSAPGRIILASPDHSGGEWVNFQFVSKEWVSALGWFACPDVNHYCWDTVAEMLGEATAIRWAKNSEFFIEHDMLFNAKSQEDFKPDCEKFLWWCVGGRREAVKRLKEAACVSKS